MKRRRLRGWLRNSARDRRGRTCDRRRDEVNATVATLTLLLQRMEAVEALRRTLRSGGAPEISQS